MTQQEIKEWLDWATEQKILSVLETPNTKTWFTNAGQQIALSALAELEIDEILQLVLQNDIEDEGLQFELNTYDKPCVEIGRNEHERLASCEAKTILEAMMLAFREAWEATHG